MHYEPIDAIVRKTSRVIGKKCQTCGDYLDEVNIQLHQTKPDSENRQMYRAKIAKLRVLRKKLTLAIAWGDISMM